MSTAKPVSAKAPAPDRPVRRAAAAAPAGPRAKRPSRPSRARKAAGDEDPDDAALINRVAVAVAKFQTRAA